VRENIAAELEREAVEAEALRRAVLPPVRQALEAARADGWCARAWLFGSFAWGAPTERSDVDLLVASCADPDRLAARLWRACGRPVHVVELEQARAELSERVLADGVSL